MKLKLFDSVELARDLPEHNLQEGDRGVIVHLHKRFGKPTDGIEVEVFKGEKTVAVLTLRTTDVRKRPL
jgi:hypothetical protein